MGTALQGRELVKGGDMQTWGARGCGRTRNMCPQEVSAGPVRDTGDCLVFTQSSTGRSAECAERSKAGQMGVYWKGVQEGILVWA